MNRPVIWDQIAAAAFIEIIRYIAADTPDAAMRVATKIQQAAESLGHFATGRPGRVPGTYEKPLGHLPYILAYELLALPDGQERVVILHLIHTARDWREDQWPAD